MLEDFQISKRRSWKTPHVRQRTVTKALFGERQTKMDHPTPHQNTAAPSSARRATSELLLGIDSKASPAKKASGCGEIACSHALLSMCVFCGLTPAATAALRCGCNSSSSIYQPHVCVLYHYFNIGGAPVLRTNLVRDNKSGQSASRVKQANVRLSPRRVCLIPGRSRTFVCHRIYET